METTESIKSIGAKSSMRSSEPFEICPFEIQKYKLYICLKTKIDPNEQLDDHESVSFSRFKFWSILSVYSIAK